MANVLPQLLSDIPMVVRRTNVEGTRHYDFRVRQPKLRVALTWLKENNKLYHDVIISEERLSQIGDDTNMEDQFHSANRDTLERRVDEGLREAETAACSDENDVGIG
jgi:hypothetical protein